MKVRKIIDAAILTAAFLVFGTARGVAEIDAQPMCPNTDCDGPGDCEFFSGALCMLLEPEGSGCGVIKCSQE